MYKYLKYFKKLSKESVVQTEPVQNSVRTVTPSNHAPGECYISKAEAYFNSLLKAKIFDFKSKKMLADLPSDRNGIKQVNMPISVAAVDTRTAAQTHSGDRGINHPAYAFRTKDGYLVGRNLERESKSPNPTDVENWLKDKNVDAVRIHPDEVPDRQIVRAVSSSSHDPHTLYETDSSGLNSIELNARIEKHPRSPDYAQNNYVSPSHGKAENYAFTPVHSMKVVRFGTPEGNLWVSRAVRDDGSQHHSIAESKDAAKRMAYNKESIGETGNPGFMPSVGSAPADTGSHLVVGSHSYLRSKMPFFALQHYDHHIFYKPTSTGHQAGVVAINRVNPNDPPKYVHAQGSTGQEAVNNAIKHMALEHIKTTQMGEPQSASTKLSIDKQGKMNTWLTHAIYRSPKVSLRDVIGTVSAPSVSGMKKHEKYFRSMHRGT
jgi:hypothetical protein